MDFTFYRPCVEVPPPGRHHPKILDKGCTFSKIITKVLRKYYMWGLGARSPSGKFCDFRFVFVDFFFQKN
eukprot:UN17340